MGSEQKTERKACENPATRKTSVEVKNCVLVRCEVLVSGELKTTRFYRFTIGFFP